MLGFLLARMGVEVCVLEKHSDFLRDFRGDTIHPSTLDVIDELGLLDEFLRRPHQEVRQATGQIGAETVTMADFTHLPTRCKFIALMPQWDFLNFLAEQGKNYSAFHLRKQAEVTGLIEENGIIAGVRARTLQGDLEVRAGLTIGADGRHSVVRDLAKLEVIHLGAPIDVLWMRVPRHSDDPGQVLGRIDSGRILVLLGRGDYWQVAYVIAKGSAEMLRGKGITFLREELVRMAPFLGDSVAELRAWDDVKLLTVAVDRLRHWSRAGLLCIGDAAHAMSPIGGVGINLAIQDAVATANILGEKLLRGITSAKDLENVQRRRMFPTRATQRLQLIMQNRVIRPVLDSTRPLTLPWPIKLLQAWPFLRRVPARLIGVGFRPEHVRTPAS